MSEVTEEPIKGRKKRQQGRVDKLTEEHKIEAKKAGVNLDTPSNIGEPITQRKARLDQAIQKGVTEDMKAGLQKISDLSPTPDIKTPEKPTLDISIKDVRKQRRAKIGDILTSIGQGLAGETVTPSRYRDALKDERLAQYNQYKATVKGARNRANEWEAGYLEDLLAELNAKKEDPNTTPLQLAQIAKIEQQTRTDLARQRQIEAATAQAKKAAAKPKTSDTPTTKVVSRVGDETYTENVPVSEAEARQQQTKMEAEIADITSQRDLDIQLIQEQLDKMATTKEGESWWEWKDSKEKANLEAELLAAKQAKEDEISNIKAKYNKPTSNTNTQQPAAEQGNQEAATETPIPGEIDIWNL